MRTKDTPLRRQCCTITELWAFGIMGRVPVRHVAWHPAPASPASLQRALPTPQCRTGAVVWVTSTVIVAFSPVSKVTRAVTLTCGFSHQLVASVAFPSVACCVIPPEGRCQMAARTPPSFKAHSYMLYMLPDRPCLHAGRYAAHMLHKAARCTCSSLSSHVAGDGGAPLRVQCHSTRLMLSLPKYHPKCLLVLLAVYACMYPACTIASRSSACRWICTASGQW